MITAITKNARKLLLLLLSLGIYALFSLKALPVMLILIVLSYFGAQAMDRCEGRARTLWCTAGAIITVSVWVLHKDWVFRMPVGISFYSFKLLSGWFDVYRKKRAATRDFLGYAVCISLFSEILSGPISRPDDLLPQLESPRFTDKAHVENGLLLIISGLFKKYVIADRLAAYTDTVFGTYTSATGIALWMAVFFYTIQIYCDFAGYSQLSIGVSSLLGLDIKANFYRPYFAVNIKDFWHRWHISLSSWLRDYIYIPLGGNRKGKLRKALNIMITFVLSGFWHGNGTGFLLWGAWHGILNLLPQPRPKRAIAKLLSGLGTFAAVAFGWIFFRLENAADGFRFLARMFTGLSFGKQALIDSLLPFTGDNTSLSVFLITCVLILAEALMEWRDERRNLSEDAAAAPARSLWRYALCLAAALLLGVFGSGSFIYMNF